MVALLKKEDNESLAANLSNDIYVTVYALRSNLKFDLNALVVVTGIFIFIFIIYIFIFSGIKSV